MCLGLLGRVVAIEDRDGLPTAVVDVDGARHEACLAVLPDARVGDEVLLHLGFVVARMPPGHAGRVRDDLARAVPPHGRPAAGPPRAARIVR